MNVFADRIKSLSGQKTSLVFWIIFLKFTFQDFITHFEITGGPHPSTTKASDLKEEQNNDTAGQTIKENKVKLD